MDGENLSKWGVQNLRKVFLFDGFGALLSAFLLGVVLVALEDIFGIPSSALYILAFIPCLFFLYDLFHYFSKKEPKRIFLQGIAYANIAYCVLSLGFAFFHFEKLTFLGWTYIILEIILVCLIAIWELKVAKHLP